MENVIEIILYNNNNKYCIYHNMSITIQNYMINLIAGRSIIGRLYDNVTYARIICAKGGTFNFIFGLQGFGTKKYCSKQLINFDDEVLCSTVEQIFINIGEKPTLDQMIIILLKGKNEIRKLYGSFYRAEDARANAKILCYNFDNPYKGFVKLNKDKIRLNGKQVLDLFAKSNNIIFDPNIILL